MKLLNHFPININKEKIKHIWQKPAIQIVSLSLFLLLFVETCSRESLFSALATMFTHPFFTLYNLLLIAITLTPALIFTRRYLYYLVLSILWVIIGVTDFVLLQFRTTPFTFVDLTMIRSAIAIWDHYLAVWQLVLIGIALLGAIVSCVILFRKIKRVAKLPLLRTGAILLVMIAGAVVSTDAGVRFDLLSKNFGNIADAYHEYGVPYCFLSGIFNTGITKPKKYSDEYVQQIIQAIEAGQLSGSIEAGSTSLIPDSSEKDSHSSENKPENPSTPAPTQSPANPTAAPTQIPEPTDRTPSAAPNIIFLQLESFFDPTTILGTSFTSDPLPNFHRLASEFSSGYLRVPSIGAGTANTEFEVITGMNLDFFGPGEYPYKTILQETTCESAAYVLKNLGYGTHAIHNNDGTFYGRHTVFPNLGFDTFTSIEYMQNVNRTPLNWAKDKILVDEIRKALESTDTPDYIYTISVQGHGSYPTEPVINNPVIDLTLPEELSEDLYYPLLYYTNQIYEMDLFIAELTDYLKHCGEDTVLVMYGDHLPGFKLAPENVENDLFETPYILWTNFEQTVETKTVEAYQLYSYVFGRLGIHEGILNSFHQSQLGAENYLEDLEILEYDMLYGDKEVFADSGEYLPTEMKMGIDEIHLTSIQAFKDSSTEASKDEAAADEHSFIFPFGKKEDPVYTVFLRGYGFTPYSVVFVNGEPLSTMYISNMVLSAIMPLPEPGDELTIAQRGIDEQVLSTSNTLIVTEEILEHIFPEKNPELNGED